MSVRSLATVVGLSALLVTSTAGAAGAATTPDTTASSYVVEVSPSILNFAGTQTFGSVSCPAHHVVVSGGALASARNLQQNIGSSWPENSTTWAVEMNNASTIEFSFTVYAVCITKVKGYLLEDAGTQPIPTNTRLNIGWGCSSHDVVYGGGGVVASTSTAVNINASFPVEKDAWAVTVNNASASDTSAHMYSICGKKLKDYKWLKSGTIANPAGQETFGSTQCPFLTAPVGGGIDSLPETASNVPVTLNSSFPDQYSWEGYENNGTTAAKTIVVYIICAAATP